MKNIPEKIYLQIGEAGETPQDFNELSIADITWSADKINDSDIKYVLANVGQSEQCSGCEESTGETKIWCCNHCGKRVEDF